MKKTHIGNHGTPKCTRGMSMHRAGIVRPAITVTLEQFQKLPADKKCARCAALVDTTEFAKGLAAYIGLRAG